MAHFDVQGPFWLPTLGQGMTLAPAKDLAALWESGPLEALGKRRGVFVFVLKWGGRLVPYYVDRSGRRTFANVCTTPARVKRYETALKLQRGGTPGLFFVVQRGTETDSAAVREIEDLFLDLAVRQNPHFARVQGKKGHSWGIEGMVRSKAGFMLRPAEELKLALGLRD